MRKLYVFLPCYNEADNIGKLLENWEEQKEVLLQEKLQLEIKVINDASTDKTETVVKEKTVGRNDACPCGSGKKYKKCCGK